MFSIARVLQASLDAQTVLKLQLQDMDMLKEKVQSYKVTRQQMQQQATLIAELRCRVHTHAHSCVSAAALVR